MNEFVRPTLLTQGRYPAVVLTFSLTYCLNWGLSTLRDPEERKYQKPTNRQSIRNNFARRIKWKTIVATNKVNSIPNLPLQSKQKSESSILSNILKTAEAYKIKS